MAISFPASLDVLTNPGPTDKQNVVSHSGQHGDANDAIEALEAKVGANGSAVQTSHDYKLSAVTGAAKAVTSTDARLTDARTPLSHIHPISDVTSLQSSMDAKAPLASPTFSGTVTVPDASFALAKLANMATASLFYRRTAGSGAPEVNTLAQLKTDLALVKGDVGLGSVDNTTDAGKPVSTAQQAALDLKAPLSAFARVTGSNATTTGQALVDVTGLSIALLANSVYEFEAVLSVQASSTAGNQYGVQFSAAGATIEAQISGTLAAATSRSDRISALNTAAPALVTSGATGGVRIQGIISTGANAGNLTIRHLKVTSGTSTVFINSLLKTTKI